MSGILTLGGKILAQHDTITNKLTISDSVQFPAGHIIQTKLNHFDPASTADYVEIDNSGGVTSNPDNLNSTQNRYFGGWPNDNRVIVEIMRVSITIRDASNDLLVFCSAGADNGIQSTNGGFGFIVGVPHDGNSGEAYDLSNYPNYVSLDMPSYPPDWSAHFGIKGSSGCLSARQTDVKLYAFAYSEGNRQMFEVRRAEMTVMEVQT